MIDAKTKARIIGALRKVSRMHPARNFRKASSRIDKALYMCESCSKLCYEGKSVKGFEEYKTKYNKQEIMMEKGHMDHIIPVIPTGDWEFDWNTVITNMFPPLEGWQYLCASCHKMKTKDENKFRLATRQRKRKKGLEA
jgi:hypothetical protein